jgi:peroxiredoxin family protein
MSRPVASDTLGILLISGDHARAHYAFVLACGAAAVGREVVLFATHEGCGALLADLSGSAAADAALAQSGVAGLATLRAAAVEMGIRMIVCEAGLRSAGITAGLLEGVEIAGVVSFLSAAPGQVITL